MRPYEPAWTGGAARGFTHRETSGRSSESGATIIDWDDAYTNAAYIPDAAAFPDRWAHDAAAFRATATAELDIAYGPSPRERFDLFRPDGDPRGLAVFVHGGYWLDFDKSSWSWLAAGPLAHGWAVAVPSYDLCPHVHIADITTQVGAAIAAAAQRVGGPIVLAGHSAGGHLVTRMICADGPLSPDVRDRIRRVVGISGLYDLKPLMRTAMNASLRLDEAEACAESPALLEPTPGARLVAYVGGLERPEFLRQSALIAQAWSGHGAEASYVEEPDRHHFNIINTLSEPDGALCRALTAD